MKNRIFNIAGSGLLALTALLFFACNEIPKGHSDIDSWPEVKDYTPKFQHPCMLHTDADFEFVKGKVQAGTQPWSNAYAHLEQSKHAVTTWVAQPVVKLARLDATNWATIDRWVTTGIASDWYNGIHTNYTNLMYDAASAYQLALRWKITGNDAYAVAGIAILNAWMKKCTGYIVNTAGEFIDPNEYLIAIQVHQLANAAEILRASNKWAAADFTSFKTWMSTVFYPPASKFLSLHSNNKCALHYWLNWDLANMTAVLSIGILTEDNYKINEAIQYFKYGIGSGNIENAVPFTYKDPDGNETIGQCQESGRDQGHATLCVSLMAAFCQMAKNIGEDLFTYDNNRALAMCEYVGKYNIGAVDNGSGERSMTQFVYDDSRLPFTTYTNCEGGSWDKISPDSRGTVRPSWELVNRLAQDYGVSDVYTKMWVNKMREYAPLNFSDGGQGDYGGNSGGYDQLGWGTLMFAKE